VKSFHVQEFQTNGKPVKKKNKKKNLKLFLGLSQLLRIEPTMIYSFEEEKKSSQKGGNIEEMKIESCWFSDISSNLIGRA